MDNVKTRLKNVVEELFVEEIEKNVDMDALKKELEIEEKYNLEIALLEQKRNKEVAEHRIQELQKRLDEDKKPYIFTNGDNVGFSGTIEIDRELLGVAFDMEYEENETIAKGVTYLQTDTEAEIKENNPLQIVGLIEAEGVGVEKLSELFEKWLEKNNFDFMGHITERDKDDLPITSTQPEG